MNKEQIKNTALGLAALVTINTAGCSNLATKKDIEESNKKISSIDTHNKERFDEIESLIKKSQEEANKKAKEVAGIDFNKGESIYTLNIEAGTIKKVYSKEGLLVRDQVTGKTYTTDQDTILFIIPGVNKNDITLENLPKKGTNLRDIEDKEVKNYTDFTKKYADELKPEKTGIQNIIVADFDCNGEVRIRSARIVPKTKIEEVKKEEVKKEEPKKEVKTPKSQEKQSESPKKEVEAPKKPEQKKPEQPKQPEARKQPEAPKQPKQPKEEILNLYEPLIGTLDEFGTTVHETTPLSLSGQVYDRGLDEGDIVVLNAYAIHDNGSVYEKNVLCYYKAPKGGARVRFTGYDGMVFLIKKGNNTLNQSIAAMRETLIRAHGANLEEIKFKQLVRYGDKVNNRISFIAPLAI